MVLLDHGYKSVFSLKFCLCIKTSLHAIKSEMELGSFLKISDEMKKVLKLSNVFLTIGMPF